MSRLSHVNTFEGVINKDTDPLLLGSGQLVHATNRDIGDANILGGTRGIPGNVLESYSLPSGTNEVIGVIEDKQNEYLYYFVKNSSNNHRILRYQTKSSSKIVKVAGGSVLGFSNRISGGGVVDGMLYWTDGRVTAGIHQGNPPRKINADKGVTDGKSLKHMLIAGKENEGQFASGKTYNFRIKSLATGAIAFQETYTSDGTAENNPTLGLEWLHIELSDSLVFEGKFSGIEVCDGCNLEITLANSGYYMELVTTDASVVLFPTNYYPVTLEEQHFDLVKSPPYCAPSVKYIGASTTTINNVSRGSYQFRVRYVYDDGEKSAWGPPSNVALPLGPDGILVEALNAIEIDFTDSRLSNPAWLSILDRVEVAVRDGNDNWWKKINDIPRCQLGVSRQYITWLNDQDYNVVASDDSSQGSPDTQVLKLFDEIPLIATGMGVGTGDQGDTRLYLGGITEGYSCDGCENVEYTAVDYTDDCLIDIEGTVELLSASGMSTNPDFNNYALGGFVVYIAGTNYYGISDNPTDGTGTGRFKIKGVPKGKYILRVASYMCRYNDDMGSRHNLLNGLEWQKTSSPVYDCAGSTIDTGVGTERILDTTGATGTFDLDIEPGYGPITILNAHHNEGVEFAGGYRLIESYTLDSGGDDTTVDIRMAGIGVERRQVTLGAGTGGGTLNNIDVMTDHNGYAATQIPWDDQVTWDTFGAGTTPYVPISGTRFTNNGWKDIEDDGGLYNAGSSVVQFTGTDVGPYFLFQWNNNPAWTTAHRGQILGHIYDLAGNGVPNILVSYSRGRFARTNSIGEFYINIYFENGGARSDDFLIPFYENDACYDYPPDPSIVKPNVSFGGSVGVPFTMPFYGGVGYEQRLLKSGGSYKIGVVYEDNANRTCGVANAGVVHVPFFTEIGEYKKQRIKWSINHQPPTWATHYRFVRTKNLTHSRYTQWVSDEVLFGKITNPSADPEFVSYLSDAYTHLFIRVNSKTIDPVTATLLLFYQQQEQGYTPSIGDKLRFILDENADPVILGKILEVSVVGRYVNADNYYIVVPRIEVGKETKAGWLFELYTPKGVDEQFYYDFGPCYDILLPGEAGRAHAGPLQDQDPFTNTPAQGYLETGDTYWRIKEFESVGINGTAIQLEHSTLSDYHVEQSEDIGRPFAEVDRQDVWRYNRVRFSGLYLSAGKLNNLSSFGALDYQDLNRKFGPINWLGYTGNVMLAICAYKVQPLYLGRGRVIDLRGIETIGRSDQIIGVADPSVSDGGTQNPESVVVENGRVYWWDQFRGACFRYSQAGVQDISGGLIEYFRTLSKTRGVFISDIVCGGFDRKTGTYVVGFYDGSYVGPENAIIPVDGETWGYSEALNGWVSEYSYEPEAMASVGIQFVSFKSGALWKHALHSKYNYFYSTQYATSVRFAANPNPTVVKDWQSIIVRSQLQWYAPSITIPANSSFETTMESRLKANKWAKYEGDWAADFLRDMYDTRAEYLAIANLTTRYATALLSGRRLKGHVLLVTLEQVDGSKNNLLYAATTEFSPSMKIP